ncbi:MAG TPA: TetR/AcrR family transcriptional regulator [Devosia sp.]|nr:TetR/AcrR family transcriptional regulator [Devosia sp.]
MGVARRSIGAQRNPESEKAILEAARELLVEEGLAGFSIEAVARRAHAGKPTIYRWWPSKTALLLAVYEGLKEQMVEPDTGTLEGDIGGFIGNLLRFWRDTPAGPVFRSILAEAPTNPDASTSFDAYHLERRARTARRFARHGLDSAIAELLVELIVNYCWGRLLSGQLDVDEREISRVAATLARGIGAAQTSAGAHTAPAPPLG